jgi:NAD(P)-dependent dehydrogenase (short-subunit alcohol dehydrogenase family)
MSQRGVFDLTGEVALVTGGAAGMGRAIAARMTRAGADVVVVDIDPGTESILNEHVPGAVAVIADLSKPDVHAEIIERASEAFGAPTVLVNAAGIFPGTPLLDVSAEFFDRVYNTNLRGVALLSIAFARSFIAAGHQSGAIVNVASIEGFKPTVAQGGLGPYGATKAGVIAITRHMALEFGPHGIAVNAIAPGTVLTEGVIAAVGGREAALVALAPLIARTAVGRIADPDDIAKVAVFLASDAASYVRGQTIIADGGLTLN